jgi:hypothetical protein
MQLCWVAVYLRYCRNSSVITDANVETPRLTWRDRVDRFQLRAREEVHFVDTIGIGRKSFL